MFRALLAHPQEALHKRLGRRGGRTNIGNTAFQLIYLYKNYCKNVL
jgi:hypothetical protein